MPITLNIRTSGKGLYEITSEVQRALVDLDDSRNLDGVCTVFVQHTSASLAIQENADPSARSDIEDWLERTIPENDPSYTHVDEGPDDMPSHIRSMLTGVHLVIPVEAGRLMLGTWQGIYLCEHRRSPHARRVIVAVTPGI
ncbi:MAG: secondary thiamine-phosphate synthase enzyme YjbQ [Phycisphaerales bacterium]|nr:secondary thiamine-phosphate synthase enzyme YjbQ [Phycisphaerales bacterium]